MKSTRVLVFVAAALVLMGASCEGYRFESGDPCKCWELTRRWSVQSRTHRGARRHRLVELCGRMQM